jgi:ribose transport system substrate-binding protein
MLKRWIAGVMFALMVGTVVAPNVAVAQQPGEGKTICHVTFTLQVGYFQESVAGAQKAADALGAKLIVLDPQADAAKQVTQVEDCISRGVNAIIVGPIESSSLTGVLAEAKKANIPVATLDTKVDSDAVVTLIGVEQRDASYTFCEFVAGWIIGKLGGTANIGMMIASTEVQLARRDGCVDALAAVPNAKVVATGDGKNILEQAQAAAEDMLTAHPEIDVIYATGDPALEGAMAAAQGQGRKIAFFGWDSVPAPFIEGVKDGSIVGFMSQKPAFGGETAVTLLVDYLNGKPIPARVTYNPDVVTQFNVDQFVTP